MLETIYERRSVRKYLDKPVDKKTVEEILKAGMYAPSAVNKQPWHFIVCDTREAVERVHKLHPYSTMLKTAPVCILVFGDTDLEFCPGFYITDCSAATENILLAAKALGLDTCWLGIYPHKDMQEAFSKEFNLPKNIIPFAAIALGYGDEKKELPERFDAKKIHYNKW